MARRKRRISRSSKLYKKLCANLRKARAAKRRGGHKRRRKSRRR